jgi:hypothetical protein
MMHQLCLTNIQAGKKSREGFLSMMRTFLLDSPCKTMLRWMSYMIQ